MWNLSTCHFVHICKSNSKTTCRMTALLSKISILWVRTVCELWLASYGFNHASFVLGYTGNSKTVLVVCRCFIYQMTARLLEISIFFYVRAGCKTQLVSYGSKHWSQFFSIKPFVRPDIHKLTWKLQGKYGRPACRMSALISETFFVCFTVEREQVEGYGPMQLPIGRSLMQKCVHNCKPVYTSLFGT